jgi:uncharacterized membrane protein HdeD (DUF308 family)
MAIPTLVGQLRSNWSWFALRGFAAIAFGAFALTWPGLTLMILTLVWGAYALADGVLELIGAVRMREHGRPIWTMVLAGIVGIAAGIIAIMRPGMSALFLLTCIAVWAVATGILQMLAAVQFRKAIDNEWLIVISGLLSIGFGILMLMNPGAGALAVARVIAVYAIVFGALVTALGFQIRHLEPDDRLRVPYKTRGRG